MILVIDVQYSESTAYVAGITFEDWRSESPENEFVSVLHDVAEYEPGNFYKRELPCILKLIEEHDIKPETIVVDGYVFLDDEQRPGLGKYLYDALEGQTEVIGVAKRPFSGIGESHEVLRGKSVKPLYVTTSGQLDTAKGNIASMFGEHRIPVLLKRTDQLCREEAKTMDIFWIVDNVLAGSTGPNLSEWNYEKITAQGFTSVLSVNNGEDVDGCLLSDLRVNHAVIPMTPRAPPESGDVEICIMNLALALEFIKQNQKCGPVLMHCRSGKDRTGLVGAAYLMVNSGISEQEAITKFMSLRPVAFSADGWQAFAVEVLSRFKVAYNYVK